MQVDGTITKVVFHNEDNGFAVIQVMEKGKLPITASGTMSSPHTGMRLKLVGDWKQHPSYGKQFVFEGYEELVPDELDGIRTYLASGFVKGIKQATAKQFVNSFGKSVFDVIENHPEKLAELPGIGKKRAILIHDSYMENKELRELATMLQAHGISTTMISKIHKRYGSNALHTVQQNPYQLCEDINGIGFAKADEIAMKLGIEKNNPFRIAKGIRHCLLNGSTEGHCFLLRETLIQAASRLLSISMQEIDSQLSQMVENEEVVCEGDHIFLPSLYGDECICAERLTAINHAQTELKVTPAKNKSSIVYDEIQLKAIFSACSAKTLVLTGGPGTGKTTTTKGIIDALRKAKAQIILCAPTGRAAKRLSEATGMPAKTIHRLLGYSEEDGFTKNKYDKINADVVICDECSMISVSLMASLLDALEDRVRFIMVGDIDQLPSVGPGNVLRDIIDSGVIPVVQLQRVFRQAQESMIIANAHRIRLGQFPILDNKSKDFFFIKCEDEKIPQLIVDLVTKRLPGYFQVNPIDIQVLTPMNKGPLGTIALNELLREQLNPGDSNDRFRVNDRVMQTKNNYELEVFNGDTGIVQAINDKDEEKYLQVLVDDNTVEYAKIYIDQLLHAYAVTIHKSQGSEYPVVIIPMSLQHSIMLKRNLLYTGVTRAKKGIVLVGNERAIAKATHDNSIQIRNTSLALRLRIEEAKRKEKEST